MYFVGLGIKGMKVQSLEYFDMNGARDTYEKKDSHPMWQHCIVVE